MAKNDSVFIHHYHVLEDYEVTLDDGTTVDVHPGETIALSETAAAAGVETGALTLDPVEES